MLGTNATTRNIREKLSNLDRHLPSVGHDIGKFNLYVKEIIRELTSRKQTTTDLLVNLFKAYQASTDKQFVRYIERK